MRSRSSVVDLFSGPGGFSEGFTRAGFRIAVAVDSDKYACQTYQLNHKDVALIQRDITSVSGSEILDVAARIGVHDIGIVIGGPPCRGLSMANARTRGPDNPNNKLFYEYIRLVSELKPQAFVLENVRALYHFDGGKFREDLRNQFENLGFKVACTVLNAASYGVPQIRRRTFMVGLRRDYEFEFPEPKYGPLLKDYLDVSEAISDLPPIPDGGGGADQMEYCYPPRTPYQDIMRRGSLVLRNHVTTRSTPEVVERFIALPPGGNWRDIVALLQSNGKYEQIERTHRNIYRRMDWHEPSYTMVNPRKSMYVHPEQNRLLSVREAARIQSFNDSYCFSGLLHSMQQQVADAVPVSLAENVGIGLGKYFPSIRHMLQVTERKIREHF